MSTINSGATQNPTAFINKDCRSSISISLTDGAPDASWRLRIEVEVEDGGRYCLGAVDTIPPQLRRIRNPNGVVAVCSVPNVRNWYVYHELLTGTPPLGRSQVTAEMKISAACEYGGGCCPLVAVPGHSINVEETDQQSPNGGPVVAPRITLYTGSGFALAADVAYLGLGADPTFMQLHDAGASDPVSTATMIGIGYPYLLPATQTLAIEWHPGRRFLRGFTVALSLAQNTFAAVAENISAFGQWSVWHD